MQTEFICSAPVGAVSISFTCSKKICRCRLSMLFQHGYGQYRSACIFGRKLRVSASCSRRCRSIVGLPRALVLRCISNVFKLTCFDIYVRSKPMYEPLEHESQPRITKALDTPNPNVAPLIADVQAMLAKFDETVALIAPMPPLNSFYDEIARLRIVRAHLREVSPALKAGNFAKARKSFQAFDDNWDSIEDLIKARNADSYVAIEKGMIAIEKALTPDKPDIAQVTTMVNEVMRLYNDALAEVVKDARARS